MQKANSTNAPSSVSFFTSFPPLARFKNSRFDNEQDLAAFTERFDVGLKWAFSDSSEPQYVKFGSQQDNDPRCDVRAGKLCLPG